jgi:hypothetical protein
MNNQMERIKADYTKYLRHIMNNYNGGADGQFPPEQDPNKMLEWEEFVEWWKKDQIRFEEWRRSLNFGRR